MRDKLVSRVFSNYYRHTLTTSHMEELSQRVASCISGTLPECVAASLTHLLGRELTPELAYQTAWCLAGNADLLRDGAVVVPWAMQRSLEWVPVEVLEAAKTRNNYGFGIDALLVVLAGSCAGMRFRQFMSDAVCRVASLRIGFTRRHGAYPYHGSVELAGLRLFVQMVPAAVPGRLSFSGIRGAAGLTTYNRQMVLNYRVRKTKCPRGYKHPCRQCVIGRDQCGGAVFPRSLLQQLCPVCHQAGFFDPQSMESCVECQTKARLAVK